MIVYENTLNNFIIDCNNTDIKISDIIKTEMIHCGFNVGTQGEIDSWNNSLPILAKLLNDDMINKDINVAIEYKFDITKNRIDFLIYGKNEDDNDSIVIVELKQWSKIKDSSKPNFVYTYSSAGAKDYLHPSYQSYRYGNILKGFNEYVQNNDVAIQTCSYLHNLDNIYEFIIENKDTYPFIKASPVFLKDDDEKLKEFVKKYVKKPHRKLLYEIDNSRIRPSNDFSKTLFDAIKGQIMFTLDDEQATSVSTIVSETAYAINQNKRRTIIIKGGPGSGKSVVAINAMGQLIHPLDGSAPKNVCYCTTNFTPRTLFKELLINNDYKKNVLDNLFKSLATFSRASEFDYDCIIIDEAHRVFKWKFGQGIKSNVDMVDKIFYASRTNVFFIDEDQMVTKDDYLTLDLIKEYAKKYNSEIIEAEDLHLTSQFRCLGGENYISFVNSFLGYNDIVNKYHNKNYDFQVFDSPLDMWNKILEKQKKYPRSRLLAGYTHEWVSKEPGFEDEFDFILENGKFKMRWNKKVEWSYINDLEQFDRIGCIHTIQGVDMDYAGVIIGKDVIYIDGKIVFDQSQNAKSDKASGIRKAKPKDAEKMIRNTYKVLLTRAIYGTYVYCEDKALNDYLKSLR